MPLENGDPSAADILALANRLHTLKSTPGFHDLKRIAGRMEQEAMEAVLEHKSTGSYEKDRDEIFNLKMRAEVAKLMIAELFGRMDATIATAKEMLPGVQLGVTADPPLPARIAGSY